MLSETNLFLLLWHLADKSNSGNLDRPKTGNMWSDLFPNSEENK